MNELDVRWLFRLLEQESSKFVLSDDGELWIRTAHVALPVRVLRRVRRYHQNMIHNYPSRSIVQYASPFVAGVAYFSGREPG